MRNLTLDQFRAIYPMFFGNDVAEFSDGREYDAVQIIVNNCIVIQRAIVTYGDTSKKDTTVYQNWVWMPNGTHLRSMGKFATITDACDFARQQTPRF
jgi:hypothetical protein